jgi:hypothetical protein
VLFRSVKAKGIGGTPGMEGLYLVAALGVSGLVAAARKRR